MSTQNGFTIVRKVAQSTGIDYCEKANFTSKNETDLIVCRANVLQIYTLHIPIDFLPNAKKNETFPQGIFAENDHARLSLAYETSLFSNIQAMGVVRLPGNQTDAIILCFADAKVSVLNWDAEKRDLAIVSLHYFEKDAGLEGGGSQFVVKQKVIVDYENRCTCVLIYDEMLAVIPFVSLRDQVHGQSTSGQSSEMGGQQTAQANQPLSSTSNRKQLPSSYLVHLPEIGITNIKDIKFLHGYYEPTIMVLYEPIGTWSGRLAGSRNTAVVAIIELDIHMRRKMLIWSLDKLPHDTYRICPLLNPGGACLFSSNAIMFIDHSTRYRLSLNFFGDKAETDSDVVGKFVFERSKFPVSLDNARFTFLSESSVLLSIETGALYVMTIVTDGRTVTHIDLFHAGNSTVTKSLCTLNSQYVFVAAHIADSFLIKYTPRIERREAKKPKQLESEVQADVQPIHSHFNDWVQPEDMDEHVEKLLYKTFSHQVSSQANEAQDITRWDLKVVDHLVSTAPMEDFVLRRMKRPEPPSKQHSTDPHYVPVTDRTPEPPLMEDDSDFDIVAATGHERSGAICVIKKSMPHNALISVEIENADAAWSVLKYVDQPRTVSFQANGMDIDANLNDLPSRKGVKRNATEAFGGDPPQVSQNEVDASPNMDVDSADENANNIEQDVSSKYPQHKYLIISKTDSTMILEESDAGILPLEAAHGFATEEASIGVGNLGGSKYIVQVCFYHIGLLNESLEQVQKISAPGDLHYEWFSISDPFVAVLLSNKTIGLYYLNHATSTLTVVPTPALASANSEFDITTLHLFMDSNNMVGFNHLNKFGEDKLQQLQDQRAESQSALTNQLQQNLNDDVLSFDELNEMVNDPVEAALYGESYLQQLAPASVQASKSDSDYSKSKIYTKAIHAGFLVKPVYLAISRKGVLEIWRILDHESGLELVFKVSNAHNGRQFLDHENETKKPVPGSNITEICIASVGSQNSMPFMILKLGNGSILTYRCHYFRNPLVGDRILPIRFSRLTLNLICRNLPEDGKPDQGYSVLKLEEREELHATMIPFHGLSARYNGVFIGGDMPMWLFCERDLLRAQRVSDLRTVTYKAPEKSLGRSLSVYSAPVRAFTPLNMDSCPHGFMYVSNNMMTLASLDPSWDVELFGSGMCAMKVPMDSSVHSISYDVENDLIAVTTSKRAKESVRYLKGAADDRKEADIAKKIKEGLMAPIVYDLSVLDPRLPPIWEDVYSVKMIDPDTWQTLCTYSLNPDEIAIAKCVKLMNYIPQARSDMSIISPSNTTAAAKKMYVPYKIIPVLVVGTAIARGEDAACKGRLIVLDVVAEHPAEDGTKRAHFEVRTTKSTLQPITCLEPMNGSLVSAEGRQFFVYELRVGEGMYRTGWLDARLCTVSLSVVKNYILYGDVHQSVRVMRWVKAPHNWLQMVAKDTEQVDVVGTGILVQNDQMWFVSTDEKGNIFIHTFVPSTNPDVCAKMDSVGDFHYGTRVRRIIRYRNAGLPNDTSERRNHSCILSGQDGSVGFMSLVPPQAFNLLKRLESHLVTALEHTAGLHPFAFRTPKPAYRLMHVQKKSVLDGELLWKFLQLERTKQEELAAAVQAPADYIIDLLAMFSLQSSFE